MIHCGARWGVAESLWPPTTEYPGGNPLLHHHHSNFGLVVGFKGSKARHELGHLILLHCVHLAITNTVSEHYDPIRQGIVDLQSDTAPNATMATSPLPPHYAH